MRSADAHGHEDLLAVALDQQRDMIAGFVELALQLRDRRDLRCAYAHDDVARLNAGQRRGSGRIFDEQSIVPDLRFLVIRQWPHRDAELALALRRRVRACDLRVVVERADRRGERHRTPVTPDVDVDLRPRRHVADAARDIGTVGDRYVVDLADDVARLEAGLVGGAALLDAADDGAVRIRQVEALGQRLVETLDADAKTAMVDLAVLLQLLRDVLGNVCGNRERQSHEAAGTAVDLRIDADELAGGVEQRAARIAGIDR